MTYLNDQVYPTLFIDVHQGNDFNIFLNIKKI